MKTISRPGRRSPAALTILLLLQFGAGCKSAEERCAEAQAKAATAWGAYAGALTEARDKAQARTREIAATMRGEVEKRLSRKASAEASRLHDEGTAEWHRTFDAHFKAGCTGDPECSRLRLERVEQKDAIASLEQRLTAVQAAQAAATGDPEHARVAASEIEDDFDFPQLKAARMQTQAATAACTP